MNTQQDNNPWALPDKLPDVSDLPASFVDNIEQWAKSQKKNMEVEIPHNKQNRNEFWAVIIALIDEDPMCGFEVIDYGRYLRYTDLSGYISNIKQLKPGYDT